MAMKFQRESVSTKTARGDQPGNAGPARAALTEEQIQQRIRERAYLLFEKRGCVHGFADQDWIKAESQIRKELRLS